MFEVTGDLGVYITGDPGPGRAAPYPCTRRSGSAEGGFQLGVHTHDENQAEFGAREQGVGSGAGPPERRRRFREQGKNRRGGHCGQGEAQADKEQRGNLTQGRLDGNEGQSPDERDEEEPEGGSGGHVPGPARSRGRPSVAEGAGRARSRPRAPPVVVVDGPRAKYGLGKRLGVLRDMAGSSGRVTGRIGGHCSTPGRGGRRGAAENFPAIFRGETNVFRTTGAAQGETGGTGWTGNGPRPRCRSPPESVSGANRRMRED